MATEDKRALLGHFLAALAYRTQKAMRDAPANFGSFRVEDGVRTPAELVRHMTSVLGYARTHFIVAEIRPDRLGPDQANPVSPDKVWPEAPKQIKTSGDDQ